MGVTTNFEPDLGFWRAEFDDGGSDAIGTSPLAAIVDLMSWANSPEDIRDVFAAALRADLDAMLAGQSGVWPESHSNIARIAYERAIQTVEGIL